MSHGFSTCKNWWQTSVQARRALFDLLLLWLASKEISLQDWTIFEKNKFQTMQNLYFRKKFWKTEFFFFFQKIPLTYWMTLINIIGTSSDKRISLNNWMTFIYIIGPSSVQKQPLIYGMTLINIIGTSSHKRISLIYWITFIYIIYPSSVQKRPLIYGMNLYN